MIRHEKNKYVLYSHDGSRVLGRFNTEEEALKHERLIKHVLSNKESATEVNVALVEAIYTGMAKMKMLAKEQALSKIQKSNKKIISNIFLKQGEIAEKVLKNNQSEFTEADTDKIDRITNQLYKELEDNTSVAFALAIKRISKISMQKAIGHAKDFTGINIKFDLEHPVAQKYLNEHAATAVTGINKTTRDSMAVLLKDSFEKGDTYQEVAKKIKDQFDGFAGLKPQHHIQDRATLVAVTESANAYGYAGQLFDDELTSEGLKVEKMWYTSHDDRVSDGCWENENAGWIPSDAIFPSGHEREPRFPGCRCTTLSQVVN
jgi:hypothetical protein